MKTTPRITPTNSCRLSWKNIPTQHTGSQLITGTAKNRAKEVLAPYLNPETVQLLDKIKPTKWHELKTDAINFDDDFLWFDDDLWPEELKALEEHEAAEQFVLVKLDEDPDMLKKLTDVIKSDAQPQ